MATTETLAVDFDGHRLAYRLSGRGPALVYISQYWRRATDEVHVRLLADRCKLFHITPVGYGMSDRVAGYAGSALVDQVHAVLDRHGSDRFVIWGYSAGGAMAAAVARATPRAAGLVCGGYSLPGPFPQGALRQLDRRLRGDHASRSLWSWVSSIDWHRELAEMRCPRLLYWGSDDRQMASRLRRAEGDVFLQRVDFIEFTGLDHGACNDTPVLEHRVVPTVADWIASRVGDVW